MAATAFWDPNMAMTRRARTWRVMARMKMRHLYFWDGVQNIVLYKSEYSFLPILGLQRDVTCSRKHATLPCLDICISRFQICHFRRNKPLTHFADLPDKPSLRAPLLHMKNGAQLTGVQPQGCQPKMAYLLATNPKPCVSWSSPAPPCTHCPSRLDDHHDGKWPFSKVDGRFVARY